MRTTPSQVKSNLRNTSLQTTNANISWFLKFEKFIYNKLPEQFSHSTKKGIVQITKALSLTFILVFLAVYGEAFLKEKESNNNKSVATSGSTSSHQTVISPTTVIPQTNTVKSSEQASNQECKYKYLLSAIICPISESKLLSQVQNIGVISAAILFFLDTLDRKKQLERQAWQLIDGAQGSETSGARRQAIEELYEEGSNITGLDADGADLRGINLSGANLTRASFKKAILEGANFEQAILYKANFTEAKLQGANFSGANLKGAIFTGADLTELINDEEKRIKVNLKGADLGRAILAQADLCDAEFGIYKYYQLGEEKEKYTNLNGADLTFANIRNVSLNNVSINKAKFSGARTGEKQLDVEIIRNAEGYEYAYYGQDFCDAFSKVYPDVKLTVEQGYEEQFQQRLNQAKIPELIQRFKDKISTYPQNSDILPDLILLLNSLEDFFKSEQESNCISHAKYIRNKTIDFRDEIVKLDEFAKEGQQIIQHGQDLDKKMQESQVRIEKLNEQAKLAEEEINNTDTNTNNI